DYERLGRLERDPFELDDDLVSRFLVTPPPDDLLETLQTESGTETEDPGLRTPEDTGGERARDEEGRVGRDDAEQEDTQIQGEVTETIAAAPEGSLLGALGGGGQNAIAAALDVPDIGAILGGMGDAPTMVGRGSGGAGLRGLGMGGGGTGAGSLLGAGALGTGVGAGMGGRGMGSGGPGVMGRVTMERSVRVQRGMARTNGYLSPEQILRVVRANQNAIKYCYENEVQRQPNLRGAVTLDWTVGLDGRVTQARIARSTLRSSRVEGCMVRQVRRWRFPRPDGGVCRVQFPFNFGVSGG
ncbi:MAG: AgmX/PglI C-terminal domain-containing protein, partial [Myxococcota bacterium]